MGKGGKILNPADKARREARKKELKKNKKQRQQVRSAVIENKDPDQIVNELEELDRVEFDAEANTTSSMVDIYKDKRKRLKETLNRIIEYYQKEDPDKHTKLKNLMSSYEQKHRKLAHEFETIKAAREVKLEDIFLPPDTTSCLNLIPDDDPLMSESVFVSYPFPEGVQPPGCPPGLPPDLKLLADRLNNTASGFVQTMSHDWMPASIQAPPNIEKVLSLPSDPKFEARGQMRHPPRFSSNKRPEVFDRAREKNVQPVKVTKSAIIESEPVKYLPKSTKFVPASVRSKVAQTKK